VNDVLAYALLLAHDDPEATAALRAMMGDPNALNEALRTATAVKEDRGNLVKKKITDKTGKQTTVLVNPNAGQPTGDTAPVSIDDAEATAKIAKLPGLNDQDRKGLFGAVKSIYAGGKKAVQLAKAVTLALHDEAKLWATKLALAGVTYEDALPDSKELSNPLTGSTSATGGVDIVAQQSGIPAASFIATKLAAPVATFALAKVKSLLAGMKTEGIIMEADESERTALIAEFRAALMEAFKEAMEAGEKVQESFSEDDHPRDDNGRFVSADDINDALGEPDKVAALRARVTDPAQREKLNIALGETDEPGSPDPEESGDPDQDEPDPDDGSDTEEPDDADHSATHSGWTDADSDLGEESDLDSEDPDNDKPHVKAKAKAEKELDRTQAKEEKDAKKSWKERHKQREKRHEMEMDEYDAAHEKAVNDLDSEADRASDEHDAAVDTLDSKHEAELAEIPENDPSRPFVEKRQARERSVLLAKGKAAATAFAGRLAELKAGYLPGRKSILGRQVGEDGADHATERDESEARYQRHLREPDELTDRLDAEWRDRRKATWLAAHRQRYAERKSADPAAHAAYYTPEEHARYGG
jgi:hypothetical protein